MAKPSKPEKLPEPANQPPTTPPEEETEARELALEILPYTAAGIAVLAGDLSISSWNPQAERITGFSLKAVARGGLVQLFEPAEVMHHILRKVQDGIPTLSEYLHLRHADGHLLSVTVQCSPQRYLNRNDCQVVVAFRELQPLQERLRRDEHLQMLGRLASALSHEIRNPLNAIFLHADILEEELLQLPSNPHEQIVESLGEIKTEIGRLDDLVQDYLSLARLSELSREPADMGGLVKAMGLELHEQLESRNIALHLKDLDHLGEVFLNRNAFRRAVLNLIHNAMDAMPHGGTLTLCGKRTPTHVHLEVRDTGSGIAEEQYPLLFTPFHTTKPDGTGMGLYVVQQIVEAHYGEISVAGEPNTTVFTISLPLDIVDPANAP